MIGECHRVGFGSTPKSLAEKIIQSPFRWESEHAHARRTQPIAMSRGDALKSNDTNKTQTKERTNQVEIQKNTT